MNIGEHCYSEHGRGELASVEAGLVLVLVLPCVALVLGTAAGPTLHSRH